MHEQVYAAHGVSAPPTIPLLLLEGVKGKEKEKADRNRHLRWNSDGLVGSRSSQKTVGTGSFEGKKCERGCSNL